MRLLLIFLMVLGCQEKKQPRIVPRSIPAKPVTGPVKGPVEAWEPTEAQGTLATTTLTVGPVQVQAEQCRTEREIQTGMMFRKTMTDKEAMLFVHAGPAPRSYWMKNVTVPLSIGYIDPAGRLLEIHNMQPGDTRGVQSVSSNVQYALEVPRGWFGRKGIQPGVIVKTEKGTLPQTYFPNRR